MKHARTNKIICDNVTYRKSVISRMKGLMFRTTIHPEEAHVFSFKKPARLGFHMFFVFTSIDIIFLNKDKKVVDIKQEFKPFTTYTAQKKSVVCHRDESRYN